MQKGYLFMKGRKHRHGLIIKSLTSLVGNTREYGPKIVLVRVIRHVAINFVGTIELELTNH